MGTRDDVVGVYQASVCQASVLIGHCLARVARVMFHHISHSVTDVSGAGRTGGAGGSSAACQRTVAR
eukprot:3843546-Alexandrium_andersonii.AAC.1